MHGHIEVDLDALDHPQYDVVLPPLKRPKPPIVSSDSSATGGDATWLVWDLHGASDSRGHYIRCTLCPYLKRVSDNSRSKQLEGIRELKRHYQTKHHKMFPKSARPLHQWCQPEWGIPDDEIEMFGMYYRSSRHVAGKRAHMRLVEQKFMAPNAARAAAYETWCTDPPTLESIARGQLLDWDSEALRRYWVDRDDWDRDLPRIFCLGLLLVWRDHVLSVAKYVVEGAAENNDASQNSASFWHNEVRKFDDAFLALLRAGDAAWTRGSRAFYCKTIIPKLRTAIGGDGDGDISRPDNVEFCAQALEIKERFAYVDSVLTSRKWKPPGFIEALEAEECWVRAALKASPLAQIDNPPPRPWTQQELKAKIGRYEAAYGAKVAEEWKALEWEEVEVWRARWQSKTIARRQQKLKR